jgi:hypothetical protein
MLAAGVMRSVRVGIEQVRGKGPTEQLHHVGNIGLGELQLRHCLQTHEHGRIAEGRSQEKA